MSRKKLDHFAEMKAWDHVTELKFDDPAAEKLKGTWGQKVLVELGCGRGDFAVGLAKSRPDWTIVGVDIKGSRMWHGAKAAVDLGLKNLKFLRTQVEDLGRYFGPGELDSIWVTFADPHPTKGRAKKRLSSPRFLKLYQSLLKPGGTLELKTDSDLLFESTLESLEACGWTLEASSRDLHNDAAAPQEAREILTQYEQKYMKLGKAIFYVKARHAQ